ncbi:MAG: hypothetical protein LBE62_10055 [Azonexus sp.]|jgi:hypothetical protein|nr:hypothetical protein [Azonexus sp.]
MKNLFYFAGFIASFSIASAQAIDLQPERVPTDLVSVEAFGPHRVLVFLVCSPEHCWHQVFVQGINDNFPPKITCSAEVFEFSRISDYLIQSSSWAKEPLYSLQLKLGSSHGFFEKASATLALKPGCKYDFVLRVEAA